MDLIISNVGRQPSATAVAVASWLAHSGTDPKDARLVLLYTSGERGTQEQAKLLSAWARNCAGIADVAVHAVAPGMADVDGLKAPGTCARGEQAAHPNHRLIFCADPGLKVMVASVVRALQPPYLRLHASDRQLVIADVSEHEDLRLRPTATHDLTLPTLFSLYALDVPYRELSDRDIEAMPDDVKPLVEQVPPNARAHLHAFDPTDFGVDAHVDSILGYEQLGWLYLLVCAGFGRNRTSPVTLVDALDHVRRQFGSLRPIMLGVTNDRGINEHLRAELRITTARPTADRGKKRIEGWLRGEPVGPGQAFPGRPQSLPPKRAEIRPQATGLDDAILTVCLGSDPSATLISICTHRPRWLILIYDKDTPRVQQAAALLYRRLESLPVGSAAFWAAGRFGRGIRSAFAAGPTEPSIQRRLDLTPGTKSQACEIARAAGTLWSLDGRNGVTKSLDGGEERALQGPPLRVLAEVTGGELAADGCGEAIDGTDVERGEFFTILHRMLVDAVRQRQAPVDLSGLLTDWSGTPGVPLKREDHFNDNGERVRLTVSLRNGEGGWLKRRYKNVGTLFEDLVGHALLAIKPDELLWSLEWAWSEEQAAWLEQREDIDRAVRRELDLALRLGHRAACISCKSSGEGGATSTAAARTEIEALAEAGFGRFALPVLVRTRVPTQDKLASRSRGVLLLDALDLSNPELLRETFDNAFQARSTLGES